MLKHYSYPSIPQFRTLLADLRHSYRYIGQSENNKPMYDENKPLPTVRLTGTVKLHGANCSVVLTRDGIFYPQSKESLLNEEINCNGFYQFAMDRKDLFIKFLSRYLIDVPDDVEAVVVYGEWCGPGIQKKVGVSQLEEPIFVIFDVRLIDSTYEKGNTGFQDTKLFDLYSQKDRIYNVYSPGFPEWWVDLDVANPETVQQQLIDLTNAVEKQCPIAHTFGIEGRGEGIVWAIMHNGRKYRMKVKGQKHSNTNVKVLAAPDVEKINSINEFIEYAFTENRYEQGLKHMLDNGIAITAENTNTFVRWVFSDVMKEETDTMVKNNISSKDIATKGNYTIRQWYTNKVNQV